MGVMANVRSLLGDSLVRGPVLVGSLVTCDPPPEDGDIDVLVLVKDKQDLSDLLDGWDDESEGYGVMSPRRSEFVSFRGSNDINVIATDSEEFYRKFLIASGLAKKFNLTKKEDRVSLFQAVLYGNGDLLS